jgi:hypothetical protein
MQQAAKTVFFLRLEQIETQDPFRGNEVAGHEMINRKEDLVQ